MSPVASFAFSVPGRRFTTVPTTLTTNSIRIWLAASCASGASVRSITTWVIPWRSRRSRKIRPPWSRRRFTQPESRTAAPASDVRSSPHVCVR
jgi:hypothetical protein